MTVKHLRHLLDGLPDDVPVMIFTKDTDDHHVTNSTVKSVQVIPTDMCDFLLVSNEDSAMLTGSGWSRMHGVGCVLTHPSYTKKGGYLAMTETGVNIGLRFRRLRSGRWVVKTAVLKKRREDERPT
jgi:hypothetical protein